MVVSERRVRGGTERRFAVVPEGAHFDAGTLASATAEDHLRLFTGFLAGLLDAFGRVANDVAMGGAVDHLWGPVVANVALVLGCLGLAWWLFRDQEL